MANPNYGCCNFNGKAWPIEGITVNEVNVNGTMLDVEATFCYLGDMLCSSGGWDSAIAARCCMAWGKLRKLLPVLTTRHLSPKILRRCTRLALAQLCSTVAKQRNKISLNCSCSTWMTAPWSTVSVAPKTKIKHPQRHYYRKLALSILRQCCTFGDLNGISCTAGHILYQMYHKFSDSLHYKQVLQCPQSCAGQWLV